MPDLEPAKGDPTAGTLRKAAARLRSLAGEVERLERWKKHLHEQVDDFANRYAQAGQAAGQLRVDLRAAESERDALRARVGELEAALDSIDIYASDTLSGRTNPDPSTYKEWLIEGIRELRNRARTALEGRE